MTSIGRSGNPGIPGADQPTTPEAAPGVASDLDAGHEAVASARASTPGVISARLLTARVGAGPVSAEVRAPEVVPPQSFPGSDDRAYTISVGAMPSKVLAGDDIQIDVGFKRSASYGFNTRLAVETEPPEAAAWFHLKDDLLYGGDKSTHLRLRVPADADMDSMRFRLVAYDGDDGRESSSTTTTGDLTLSVASDPELPALKANGAFRQLEPNVQIAALQAHRLASDEGERKQIRSLITSANFAGLEAPAQKAALDVLIGPGDRGANIPHIARLARDLHFRRAGTGGQVAAFEALAQSADDPVAAAHVMEVAEHTGFDKLSVGEQRHLMGIVADGPADQERVRILKAVLTNRAFQALSSSTGTEVLATMDANPGTVGAWKAFTSLASTPRFDSLAPQVRETLLATLAKNPKDDGLAADLQAVVAAPGFDGYDSEDQRLALSGLARVFDDAARRSEARKLIAGGKPLEHWEALTDDPFWRLRPVQTTGSGMEISKMWAGVRPGEVFDFSVDLTEARADREIFFKAPDGTDNLEVSWKPQADPAGGVSRVVDVRVEVANDAPTGALPLRLRVADSEGPLPEGYGESIDLAVRGGRLPTDPLTIPPAERSGLRLELAGALPPVLHPGDEVTVEFVVKNLGSMKNLGFRAASASAPGGELPPWVTSGSGHTDSIGSVDADGEARMSVSIRVPEDVETGTLDLVGIVYDDDASDELFVRTDPLQMTIVGR